VTEHPSAQWISCQLTDAYGCHKHPIYRSRPGLRLWRYRRPSVFEQWAYEIVRSRHGRHGKMDMRRGSSVRSDGTVLTMSLCLANGISAICSIRIKNITTKLARTCHCTKTRRSRALSRPSVARWRCQFWADCTTNMFEFEFPTRTTKPVYGLRPSQIKTDRSIAGCYRAAVATKRGIYERLCGSFK